ncbi:MAG: selenide, water dikinase SelD [Deltaproteobacteria bacterium]|jgi:selenide,water dikinase|nr:selenide, water dikinase SelD [Deltaproteobacteria bacterium]
MAGDHGPRLKINLEDCGTGGCGAKIGPGDLAGLLATVPRLSDPALLVGFETADDAAVYRLDDSRALVSTADFFPPMVKDPRLFGRIAAANALSDVYAMGGRPVLALNLVVFPENEDPEILREILAGGAEKVLEAGASLAGGHSIFGRQPRYGLAVTGLVHPGKILTNSGARPGDALILTKPLGTGLIMSAHRGGLASESEVLAAASAMETLNRRAAEKLAGHPVSAATDVTGFGLLGHLSEMAGEKLTMALDFDSLPLLPGALKHARDFLSTAAGQRNRNQLSARADTKSLDQAREEILYDPQTSGGLLIALPAKNAGALLADLLPVCPGAAVIGQVMENEGPKVLAL